MPLTKNTPKNIMRVCKFQYDETCIKQSNNPEEFRSKSNMCRHCRKLYNKDYQYRRKCAKDPEFQKASELEKEIQEDEEEMKNKKELKNKKIEKK
jgi:hypothetical protein